ncbi:MAG: hypothetical protein U0104_11045 [Gemmatimonadales bacterium]|nr:hypothetical protein [Gemmatimonadales bacterium]
MGRVLTISRVTVPPDREAEYVRTVHLLAELGGQRGRSLWLFRQQGSGGRFIEFSESRTELTHRARASRTDLEQKLEARLRELATYEADAWDLWDEVPPALAEDPEQEG